MKRNYKFIPLTKPTEATKAEYVKAASSPREKIEALAEQVGITGVMVLGVYETTGHIYIANTNNSTGEAHRLLNHGIAHLINLDRMSD